MSFLHSFLHWVDVPVPNDLQSNHGVNETAADVGEDEDLVASLLDAGEDPGDCPQTEQEAGDGGQLPSVTVLEVRHDLKEFPCKILISISEVNLSPFYSHQVGS